MSSLVLLNRDGIVVRRLQLVSLPNDFVVPEGMTISWKTELSASFSNPLAGFCGHREPVEAYFYLGNAWGQVSRTNFKPIERQGLSERYGSRILVITVQGTSGQDVVELRDHILGLVDSGARWKVRNDLNPKPKIGFVQWIRNFLGQ